MRKPTILILTRSDTNQPVQSQKQARSLQFGFKKQEDCSIRAGKNKDADQLCSYCTADLRLCFRLCKLLVFSCCGSIIFVNLAQFDLVTMSQPACT